MSETPGGTGGGRSRGRLDPGRDAARWERTVGAIVRAAAPELARRRREAAEGGRGLLLDRWARPLLAAAAALVLFAAGGLFWEGTPGPGEGPGPVAGGTTTAEAPSRLEDALYPPVVARWIGGESQPTVEEIAFASENGDAGTP